MSFDADILFWTAVAVAVVLIGVIADATDDEQGWP